MSSYAATILAESSLVAYWRRNEASGTVAHDSKGTRNGTYTGSPTLGSAGLVVGPDTAVACVASSDQRTTFSQTGLPSGNADRSVECWFAISSLASNTPCFLGYGTNATNKQFCVIFGYPTANEIGVAIYNLDTALTGNVSGKLDGKPHHLVVTYTGSTKRLECYIDGIKQTGATLAADLATSLSTTGAMDGLYYYATSFRLNGTSGEVAVYNAPLTQAQVSAHYMAGSALTVRVQRSSAWTNGVVKVRRSGAWVAPTVLEVRRSSAWIKT